MNSATSVACERRQKEDDEDHSLFLSESSPSSPSSPSSFAVAPLCMDAKLLKSLKKDLSLLPCNQNIISRSMGKIRTIDRIEIPSSAKCHGATYYKIHIFFKKPQSNIPKTTKPIISKTANKKASGGSAVPDLVVLKRFSQFSSLRQEMYYHALVGHAEDEYYACALCANTVKLMAFGRAQPRLRVKLFQRQAAVCEVLESFLNSVLELVQSTSAPSSRNRCCCQGQERVPLLLYDFVFGQSEEDAERRSGSLQHQVGVNCRTQRRR